MLLGIQVMRVSSAVAVAMALYSFGMWGTCRCFSSGYYFLSADVNFYISEYTRADKEVGAIEQAHDSIVWTLAWHPLGHILCSGSNDHTSKFWTRNRPGDLMRDKYNLNTLPAGSAGVDDHEIGTLKYPIKKKMYIYIYVYTLT